MTSKYTGCSNNQKYVLTLIAYEGKCFQKHVLMKMGVFLNLHSNQKMPLTESPMLFPTTQYLLLCLIVFILNFSSLACSFVTAICELVWLQLGLF